MAQKSAKGTQRRAREKKCIIRFFGESRPASWSVFLIPGTPELESLLGTILVVSIHSEGSQNCSVPFGFPFTPKGLANFGKGAPVGFWSPGFTYQLVINDWSNVTNWRRKLREAVLENFGSPSAGVVFLRKVSSQFCSGSLNFDCVIQAAYVPLNPQKLYIYISVYVYVYLQRGQQQPRFACKGFAIGGCLKIGLPTKRGGVL